MYKEILNNTRQEFEKVLEYLKKELSRLRTGQASPSLVEDIPVDLFGSKMLIKQLGAISCPERRQIVIQPWDSSYLEPIEKALHKSQLGASPVVDKNVIRITLPPLTQEFRDNVRNIVSGKAEQTRKVLRKLREDAWNEIQKKEKEGVIREDDKFRGKDELQKLVDEYSRKIDEIVERKEKEIHRE